MATELFAGPIDYVVFCVDENADLAPAIDTLLRQVQNGAVEVLDLEIIARDAAGKPILKDASELNLGDNPVADALIGISSNILDDEDKTEIAAALNDDEIALVIIYEDRSLAATADLIAKAGGRTLWSGGIAVDDLEEALSGTN